MSYRTGPNKSMQPCNHTPKRWCHGVLEIARHNPKRLSPDLNSLQNSTGLGTNCRSLDTHIQGCLLGGSDQEYVEICGVAQATQITHKLLITGLVPGNDQARWPILVYLLRQMRRIRVVWGFMGNRPQMLSGVHGRIVGNGLQNTVLGNHLMQALEDALSLAVKHDRSHSYP